MTAREKFLAAALKTIWDISTDNGEPAALLAEIAETAAEKLADLPVCYTLAEQDTAA